MTNDYDYDYYEPSEQEKLDCDVYEDASDPDSHALQQRQDERWQSFLERHKLRTDRIDKDLKQALQGRSWKVPTWWELWQPPLLSEEQKREDKWIRQGNLIYSTHLDVEDIHYAGGGMPARSLPVACRQYLDFHPEMDRHFIDLPRMDFLQRFVVDGRITSANMVGEWGWWDSERKCIRSQVWGAREIRDDKGNQVSVAVLIKAPPPYGNWMPVLELNRGIVGLP